MKRGLLRAVAVVSAATLLLTACSGESDSGGGSLAEMDPITLATQSPYGPNHYMSQIWVDYAEAVEEASEGKITFDISYSAAIVPTNEQEAAVQDGLLDMAWSLTAYNPGELPINALLGEVAFQSVQTPVLSMLQGYGAAEFGFLSEPVQQELSNAGLVALTTLNHQYPRYPIVCADGPVTTLAEFSGKRVRVPGAGWATEVEALGGVPVSLPAAEAYEGLERGVLDCSIEAPANTLENGLFDVTDYYMFDPIEGFQGWNSTTFVISERVWSDLPLEAQQILWDKAGSVLVGNMLQYSLDSMAEELLLAEEQSGVLEYDDDVREAFVAVQDEKLAEAETRMTELVGEGNTVIDDYRANLDRWLELVQEAGYSDDDHPTWGEWAAAHQENPVDLEPFMDLYMSEVMDPHRPS